MQQILPFALIGFGLVSGLIFMLAIHLRDQAKRFIRGLTSDQLGLLSERQIWHQAMTFDGVAGIQVRRRDLARVVTALSGYVLAEFRLRRFKPKEVAIRAAHSINSNYQVQTRGAFTSGFEEQCKKLAEELILPHVGGNLYVRDGKGHENPGLYGFTLDLHSCLRSHNRQPAPQELFGYRLGLKGSIPAASDFSLPLVEPQSGFIFGELQDSQLCIFLPLIKNKQVLLAVLAKLLEIAARELDVHGMVDAWAATKAGRMPSLANVIDCRTSNFGNQTRRDRIVKGFTSRVLALPNRRQISVDNFRGGSYVSLQDGSFRVICHAKPVGLRGVETLPTGLGLPIAISGELVGELMPNNLFIYEDILGRGSRAEAFKFADILLAARRIEDGRADQELANEDAVDECLRLVQPVFVAQPPAPDAVIAADKQLAESIRSGREFEQEQLRTDMTPDHLLGEEFDSILKLKQVRDIHVLERELVVETDTLLCTDNRSGKVHRIGRFDIHLPYDGSQCRFLNKDGLVRNMNAPHVNTDGRPCLGTIEQMLPELIRKREFAEAVQVSVAFLESANTTDHWGKHVNEWQVATEDMKAQIRRSRGGLI